MIAGPPDHIVDELLRYRQLGVSHVVMDLRARFNEWEEIIDALGHEVLPRLAEKSDAHGT
jgi:hypothetical protein